jgi:pyridinium-3,5-bisthiocarboxylic acid mononucleotide nickel chelatase
VVGSGHVRTAHGLVPVPAPATALLLEDVPTVSEGKGELTTPTGAAVLAAVVDRFGPAPPMRLRGQGFGAGTKDFTERANVLRVLVGEPLGEPLPESADEVLLVETNIDDMNPQLVDPLFEALFAAGALDAWATPILMKRGRPALTVSALARPADHDALALAFFENSPTIGVRTAPYGRTVLARSQASVKTSYGPISVKLSAAAGRVLQATPEFEECRRLAGKAGVPVRLVLAEASAAAQAFLASAAPRQR